MASTDRPPLFTRDNAHDLQREKEERDETVFSLKQYYVRQRVERSDHVEEEDAGDNDWTITYTDMVTLIMAFFVFLTAMSFIDPRREEHKFDNPDKVTVQLSPFDGMGFTPANAGHPSNQDPVNSRYDDPDAETPSSTDPSPSGEQNTGQEAGQPQPTPTAEPQPTAESTATEQTPLAAQLRQLVADDNLAGQVEVISGQESVTLRISEKILFASGRANLENEGQQLVSRLSKILNDSGGMISIEGHTDNRPIRTAQFASNWELSAGRATEVLRQLVRMGLPANRLRAVAYAETRPVENNSTPEGRSTNRRVELVISTSR